MSPFRPHTGPTWINSGRPKPGVPGWWRSTTLSTGFDRPRIRPDKPASTPKHPQPATSLSLTAGPGRATCTPWMPLPSIFLCSTRMTTLIRPDHAFPACWRFPGEMKARSFNKAYAPARRIQFRPARLTYPQSRVIHRLKFKFFNFNLSADFCRRIIALQAVFPSKRADSP